MTPLIAIQLLGLAYRLQARGKPGETPQEADAFAALDDYAIIEL